MDFISNLIKRPISLVLNETSAAADKFPISSSLPNTPSVLDTKPSDYTANEQQQKQLLNNNNNNNRPSSMSSSFSSGSNIIDIIGVSEEFLKEFEDILPPPPPISQSPLNMADYNRSLSITPPPPLTPAMKASQTIDELLLEINDNLEQAGLNDDILAIASPPNNTELSPISSKAALNNSKSNSSVGKLENYTSKTPTINVTATSQTPESAAGTAATVAATVFEANSSVHQFYIDPELETGLFDDHHHQHEQQHQLNNSGVNKSSNKFVGLTEFDEAKIPELPGDLNPNIEEQYNVTFEECFIPTLTAKQSTKVPEEFIVDKTHLLLPTETDTAVSSDNEIFADCQDEDKDPLATTFAEQTVTLDTTTDMESYQSANNNTINFQLSNTMDNINDITMEAEMPQQQHAQQTQVVEELKQADLPQYEAMHEDEPMDIDMNTTMEMIQTSANNIQHVEQVLQHAENILQQMEEKKPLAELENPQELLVKQSEISNISLMVNTPMESNTQGYLEMEQSKHELSLNKSIELPFNKSKTISAECIIQTVNEEEQQQQSEKELSNSKLEIKNDPFTQDKTQSLTSNNLTIDCMYSSTSSSTSLKSSSAGKQEAKLNLTLGMSSSMTSSQKSSAPNSPSFPLKHSQSEGFPRSPKATQENSQQTPFLEKSDYFETPSLPSKTFTEIPQDNVTNLNGTFVESSTSTGSIEQLTSGSSNLNRTYVEPVKTPSVSSNLNATYVDPTSATDTKTQLTNIGDNLNGEAASKTGSVVQLTSVDDNLNGTYVESNSADTLNKDTVPLTADSLNLEVNKATANKSPLEFKIPSTQNNRLTFGVDTPTQESPLEFKIPSTQNNRLTFGVDSSTQENSLEKIPQNSSVPDNKRRTFNVQSSETQFDSVKQFPSLDKTDNPRRTFSVNDIENSSQNELSTSMDDIKQRRTFNVSSEEPKAMDTSFESMEVDYTVEQNTTMPAISNVEQRSQSPTLPTMQQRSQSPPLTTMQPKSQLSSMATIQQVSQSPPLSSMLEKSQSPPLPAKPTSKAEENPSKSKSPPPLPPRTFHKPKIVKEEPISPLPESSTPSTTSTFTTELPQHPFSNVQKRPSIHDHAARVHGDILSAKEQSNNKVQDEKDVFVEKCTPSPIEDIFTSVTASSTTLTNSSGLSEFDQSSSSTSTSLINNAEQLKQQEQLQQQFDDQEFQGNNNLIFNPSDFDYLLTKGNNNAPVDRSSLLLKFDPLLGVPVPVNQGQQQQIQQLQQLQIPTNTINPCLSPTLEEDEHNDSNRSFVIETKSKTTTGISLTTGTNGACGKLLKERSQEVKQELQLAPKQQEQQQQLQQHTKRQLAQGGNKKNATMSVDVIKDITLDNDCNKTFENSNSTQSDDKQINYKMDELEKKIKNEVLKTEDIEKKLKDAEQREEALIKRITEKDKTVSKMNGVIEAYEKAIAELIAEKEQLIQNYEKQLAEVKADRDSNYHHLTSLETTFSDLHVKYEKSKEMTCQLKANEDALVTENRKTLENLRLQEQRYDKMKNHAMQQLEIANKKLESLTRDHAIESTKLKALLKKEEIARSSINEQLAQKTKENAELVKICDELISGQGS